MVVAVPTYIHFAAFAFVNLVAFVGPLFADSLTAYLVRLTAAGMPLPMVEFVHSVDAGTSSEVVGGIEETWCYWTATLGSNRLTHCGWSSVMYAHYPMK